MKKLYFIVNLTARNGKSTLIWNNLEQILTNRKVVYEVYYTKYRGHGNELAEMISKENRNIAAIVAVGGDGTIHEVINGVLKNGVPLFNIGYIGAGSGNDFARGYQIPKKPEDALQFILDNVEKVFPKFDIGKFTTKKENPKYFISSLGVGFDAEVSKVANRSGLKKILNKLRLGFLTYAILLIKVLLNYEPKKVVINIDGQTEVYDKVWFITVSNQPFYGGGMKISPSAVPNDGILNITIVHQLTRLKLLTLFLSVFWGGHQRLSQVNMKTGSQIEINSDDMLVHAEGEIVGYSPVRIEVCKQQISYISRFIEIK